LEKYLADARRGIPQGSAASPLLAEMLLAAPLLFQVPAGGKVVVVAYADNILVMAKTASDADAMTDSLGLALKKHPAGQLWPKIKSFPAGGPIDFLGHRLTAHSDEVHVQPTPQNREKFERRMKEGLARLREPTLTPAARGRLAQDLKSDLSSHVSNFSLCDGVKEDQQYWSVQIASAKHGGSTMPQSKTSSTKRMVFWPHPDQEEVITAALEEAKKKTGSTVDTVALEAIAQAYMATGIAFKHWEEAASLLPQMHSGPGEIRPRRLDLSRGALPRFRDRDQHQTGSYSGMTRGSECHGRPKNDREAHQRDIGQRPTGLKEVRDANRNQASAKDVATNANVHNNSTETSTIR
jgi:hypothetical protein